MDLAVNESHSNNIHSLKFMNNEIITINEYGKAIHDYSGRAEDELTFEEEDVIYLSLKDETGDWVFGELNGSRGWFPSSNIRVLTEKECINEGLTWPPQSSFINSTSSFSIKSSQKDLSMSNIRKRCNSKDSVSSYNSSNHVTVPTTNEDASNPILPTPQVRSWFSKYQQIKRYQPKRGPNNTYQNKIGSSALSNPPLAASNMSERNSVIVDSERKAELNSSILSMNSNDNMSSTSKEKLDLSSSNLNLKDKTGEEDKQKENNLTKGDSDDSFNNEKFINEVASILNSESTKYISLDDKVFKEENDNSIDNLTINNTTGSIQDIPKKNESISTTTSANSTLTSEINKPISSANNSRTNLSVNIKDINIDNKKGHHSKLPGAVTTPTRVIHRVTTPTLSRQKWSDLVSSSTMQNLTKKEIQRQEVMFEMINTEKDYIKDLRIVMEIYIKPMEEMKIIRPKDIGVIFSDWENILKVHEEIMKRLDDRQKQGYTINEIGDIWIEMSHYLKVYTMYCSNHPYALIKLQSLSRNKNFTKFLESRLQLPESRNLNLANFLLKPVQRICKYPLLLREIIKNTEEDHPDYQNLVSALTKIETVITIINDAAKQTEGVHKLLELQQRFTTKVNIVASLRTIIHKSEIDIIEKRLNSLDKKKRQMYLLNDMVLLARSSNTGPDSLNTGKLKLIAMISTKEILVKDLEDTPMLKNAFELVHTGKQSYKIAVDTPMNKEVWLKMLNNVILNDVQSSKVDSVTSMKPSVETTYKSLNGKHKKKNLSPSTPDYRIATLKFGDSSMVKEVENEFNRINSQSGISDIDEESTRDDERSISSVDTDDNLFYNTNVHSSSNEMPSISEGVVSNFSFANTNNENSLSSSEIKEKKDEDDLSRKVSINSETESKFSRDEEDDYDDENSPLGENEDIFNLPIHHDSHSFDFDGIRELYLNDEEFEAIKNKTKRFSFPLSHNQAQNITITDILNKDKSESPVIQDIDSKVSSPCSEIIKDDNDNEVDSVSVKIKSNNDIIKSSNNEAASEDSSGILIKVDDTENDNINEENNDKNMIVPLNDMLEDTNVSSKKEGDDDVDNLSDSSFTRKIKSYESLNNIKKNREEESETKSLPNSNNEERIIDKSNESINIRNSSSNGSLVINSEKEEEESVSYSNDNISIRSDKRKSNESEEDFSFSKLRSMFGGMPKDSCLSESSINMKDSEEINARREELKNIILPSKIHNLPTPQRRGLIVNTLIEDNKNIQCDSPTRLIYDISKNPFIIKDISSHKASSPIKSDNNNKTKPSSSAMNISGSKVSSIHKEFISKCNEENNIGNKYRNELNNHNMAGNVENKRRSFRNDTLTKSPLTKEIQFDEKLSGSNCSLDSKQEKIKDNSNNTKIGIKSVKFGSTTTIDNINTINTNPASLCVSKRIRSPLLNPSNSNSNSNSFSSNISTVPLISSSSSSISTSTTASSHSSTVKSSNSTATTAPTTKEFISSSNSSSLKKNQSSNISKPVNHAKIVDVENVCFESSKKYVYIIEVDRGLSDISIVHHTYDDFFDLHLQLIGNFPEEAGVSVGFNKNNSKVTRRIIPDLPAQMMFVSEAIARSRITRLQEYINTILKLPGKISKHPLVMNFFKTDGKWSASVYSNKK